MTKGNVVVLGSNGHIGHAAMQGFQQEGWRVTGFGRSNRRPVVGTAFIKGDANDLEAVRSAIAGADVVVYALHLPYDKWGNGASEAQLQVVIDAMANTGKTLMFPGTIYNYRASDRTLHPGLPQSAEAPRGEIRIQLESNLRKAAAEGRFQTLIIRAGDFFGPGETGEWFEQAMLMDQAKGQVHHLADLDKRHSWAYLPDLGKAFAVVAEKRNALNAFENFHFSGHWVSHGQIMSAIQASYPAKLAVTPFPWWLIRAVGLFNPVMRDLFRMRYIWQNEMELVDPRLDALLGPGFTTPFEQAVAAVVEPMAAPAKRAA